MVNLAYLLYQLFCKTKNAVLDLLAGKKWCWYYPRLLPRKLKQKGLKQLNIARDQLFWSPKKVWNIEWLILILAIRELIKPHKTAIIVFNPMKGLLYTLLSPRPRNRGLHHVNDWCWSLVLGVIKPQNCKSTVPSSRLTISWLMSRLLFKDRGTLYLVVLFERIVAALYQELTVILSSARRSLL